ncbi:MAG: ureD [Pedosphaera sp.]|nr:ureD [Pedosphaera sp.]
MSLLATKTETPRVRAGRGHLEVKVVSGQSAATSAGATSPLKLLIPRPRGPSVWAYLSSFGGGLVAGDEISLNIDLGEQARCFVSTQASTKVYRNPDSLPCGHQLKANLGGGSLLVLAPDPVQAYAGSRYTQRQEFHLQSGSGLVLVDWFCSGRAACGERWAFNHFQSRNDVFVEGKRTFIDSLLIDPTDGSLENSQRMGRFNCLALVLLIGEPLRAAAARMLEDVSAQKVARRPSLVCSASPVAGGVLVRFAGEQVEAVGREIHRHLAFLTELLHDDPWSRKW